MDERRGCIIKILLKNLLVSLVIRTDARKRKAKNASDGVDITSRIGLGKAVLFGRGEPPSSEGGRVLACPFDAHAGNTKVDEVCAVRGNHDIVGGDVTVDDTVPVELLGRLTKLDGKRCCLFRRQRPIGFDNFGKRPTRHKVVDDNKVLG